MRIKVPHKNKIVRWIVAFCIAFILLSIPLHQKKHQYDIVVLGDSIIGNVTIYEQSVTDYMEERLQMTVFKGAIGGSCMSAQAEFNWSSADSYEWSMVKLAEAIAYDDWASQIATMRRAIEYELINRQTLYYFEDTMDTLQQIDFKQVEILIIEHGSNDYNAGRRVDNPDNPYDITTFGGALRQSLHTLQEEYPDLRIIVVSPVYCALGEHWEKTCENTKYGEGGYLKEYVAVEQQIAEEFNVEFVDAYHESSINADSIGDYLADGLHLNEAGRKLLSNFLADYIAEKVWE